MLDILKNYWTQARNQGKGGEAYTANLFAPLEKSVWHGWKLLDKVWKILAPLRKLFATPDVPSWLRAWLDIA